MRQACCKQGRLQTTANPHPRSPPHGFLVQFAAAAPAAAGTHLAHLPAHNAARIAHPGGGERVALWEAAIGSQHDKY